MAEEVTKDSNERKALPTTREGFAQAVAEQRITFRRSGSDLLVCFPDKRLSSYVPLTEAQISRIRETLRSCYRDESDPDKGWWVSSDHIRVWVIDLAQRAPSAPVLKAHQLRGCSMAEEVTKDNNEPKALPTTREGFAQAVAEQKITFQRNGSDLRVRFPDNKYSPYVPIMETQVIRILATLTSRYRDENDRDKDWWVSLECIKVWATDLAQRAPSAPIPEQWKKGARERDPHFY